MDLVKKYWLHIFVLLTLIIGIFLRLYKIDFGLPYSFIADETDIYDEVIRYALNYKFIKSLEGFSPSSYVYGMFPTYFLTLCTMVLNKSASIFKFSIDFNFYFVFMRIVTSVLSMFGVLFSVLIFKKLFKNSKGLLVILFLTALNWKLVAHSHYLNHDTYLMVLLISSLYFLISYLEGGSTKKRWVNLLLSSILFGLGVGTKITALLSFPITFLILFLKKDLKGVLLYFVGIISSFSLSNPFSIINFSSFISRIISMRTREAGVVFSSVNNNPLKYAYSFSHILTIPIFLLSLIGIYFAVKNIYPNKKRGEIDSNLYTHILLIGNVVIYTLFFSLNPRLVDRWILPVIPILCIYSVYGFIKLESMFKNSKVSSVFKIAVILLLVIFYISYPLSLFNQLKLGKPRVTAYIWIKNYIKETTNNNIKILVYTNEGRDPFLGIGGCDVNMFQVYESKQAYEFYPKNPLNYDIVVVYSGMRKNFGNKYVTSTYPNYHKSWVDFENTLNDKNKFDLVKEFKTTKLNLMGTSDIFIYKKVR